MSSLPRTRRGHPTDGEAARAPVARKAEGSATVWLWPGRALYAGPSLRLGPHSGAVACLAVGVDAPFVVDRRGLPGHPARTALIAPRVLHRIEARGERMAFLYLDSGSAADRACRARFATGDGYVATGHRDEAAVVAGAARLGTQSPPEQVAAWLATTSGRGEEPCSDPRIAAATRRLLTADEPLPAAVLANELGLSESRFLRLFRADTGTSYRRFRLWAQMHRAARTLAAGGDLTRAAADGYFASPSHLSTAFHAMFGLPPSGLLALSPKILCLGG